MTHRSDGHCLICKTNFKTGCCDLVEKHDQRIKALEAELKHQTTWANECKKLADEALEEVRKYTESQNVYREVAAQQHAGFGMVKPSDYDEVDSMAKRLMREKAI